MVTFFQHQPFMGTPRRPILRLVLICLVFGIFFVVFMPPTDTPHFEYTPHFPSYHPPPVIPSRPVSFPPPDPGPHRHRIRPQRPLPEPGAHRTDDLWANRADAVREAFEHAYNSYARYAAPHDELLPLAKAPIDNFNGWGLTIVDSLDTMWLMGLYEQFDSGLASIANITFSMPAGSFAPFFETVIRYLGGLLSAYALSHDPILLSRADDLGNALYPAFNSTSGLPAYGVNTVTGNAWAGWSGHAVWSEVLTCQLEFKYLAYLTGRARYYIAAEKVMEVMYAANLSLTRDLYPTGWSLTTGLPTTRKVSVGSFADSGYEYMLKQWLLTGRTDTKVRDLYLRSVDTILKHLTYVSPTRKLLYVTDAMVDQNGEFFPTHKLEHLTCFFPATLALGAATIPDVPPTHMWAARGLAYTCGSLYADTPTGLSPDEVTMEADADGLWSKHLARWEKNGAHGDPPGVQAPSPPENETLRDYSPLNRGYILRPETVESFYILWRTTGDITWRERGWNIFEALQRESRVEDAGFASVDNAYRVNSTKRNEMPSWFLAETLKYLFLLFSDEDLVPLDQWVFNTEAHPLPVFQWSEWEKERYGITNAIPTGSAVDSE
ncbi:glycoside hydrolase [Lactifluus volemus]|nr:glycoside hydrolase [Lactifluus volemus]